MDDNREALRAANRMTTGVATLLISGSRLSEAAQRLGDAATRLKSRGLRGNQIIPPG